MKRSIFKAVMLSIFVVSCSSSNIVEDEVVEQKELLQETVEPQASRVQVYKPTESKERYVKDIRTIESIDFIDPLIVSMHFEDVYFEYIGDRILDTARKAISVYSFMDEEKYKTNSNAKNLSTGELIWFWRYFDMAKAFFYHKQEYQYTNAVNLFRPSSKATSTELIVDNNFYILTYMQAVIHNEVLLRTMNNTKLFAKGKIPLDEGSVSELNRQLPVRMMNEQDLAIIYDSHRGVSNVSYKKYCNESRYKPKKIGNVTFMDSYFSKDCVYAFLNHDLAKAKLSTVPIGSQEYQKVLAELDQYKKDKDYVLGL